MYATGAAKKKEKRGEAFKYVNDVVMLKPLSFIFIYLFGFFVFCLFRAAPSAYGSSQARARIGAVAGSLPQGHSNARTATYTTAHGNAGSLTH